MKTKTQSQKFVEATPPCVLAMQCLCAGHARGLPANEPCDTREQVCEMCNGYGKVAGAPNKPRRRICPQCKGRGEPSPVEGVFLRPIMLHVCKDGTVSIRDKTKGEKVFNDVALPVFSVDTVEDAKQIQVHFCRLQYGRHPHPKGPRSWYTLTQFSGEIDDLDRVMADFATFWAEHIKKTPEAQAWARKLRHQLVDKLKRQAAQ